MTEQNIFEEVVRLSGLDKKIVVNELRDYIQTSGKKLEDLTLDEMRAIMAQYTRRTILQLLR